MKPKFCQYCGTLLEEGCHCDTKESFDIDEYNNDLSIQAGWAQQDTIDMYRRER